MSATSRSWTPSLSTSASVTCAGCGMLASYRERAAGCAGRAAEDHPCRMSVPRTSSRLSPSRSTRLHVRHGRRARHVRHRQRAPRERSGDSAGLRATLPARAAARARGSGRTAAPAPCPAGSWTLRLTIPGGPIGGSRSFADEHHPHELVAPGVARQDVGRWKRVAAAADRARLALAVDGRGRRLAGAALPAPDGGPKRRAGERSPQRRS